MAVGPDRTLSPICCVTLSRPLPFSGLQPPHPYWVPCNHLGVYEKGSAGLRKALALPPKSSPELRAPSTPGCRFLSLLSKAHSLPGSMTRCTGGGGSMERGTPWPGLPGSRSCPSMEEPGACSRA